MSLVDYHVNPVSDNTPPGRYEGSAPDVVPYMTVRPPGVAWRVIGSASGLIVVRNHERIRRRLTVA